MRLMLYKIAVLASAAFIGAMVLSCRGGQREGTVGADEIDTAMTVGDDRPAMPPREVMELIDAVTHNDARRFASAVSYPLARPYPLRDVDDSVKMAIYYRVMVDDSLRNVLRNSQAEEWSRNGWRGWTLADGQYLWIDEKLYELNYVSVTEKAMLNTLANEEIVSLQPEMRKGWRPEFCLHGVDNGAIYRVDSRSVADGDSVSPYRLAIYERGTSLRGHPSASMRGHLNVEGSAGMRTYMFHGRDGSRAYYMCDRLSDDELPQIVIVSAAGDSAAYRVERAYWRDYIGARHDSVPRER